MVVVSEGESAGVEAEGADGELEGALGRAEAEPEAGEGVGAEGSPGRSGAAQVPQYLDESGFAARHLGHSNVYSLSPFALTIARLPPGVN
jgi:hypothetical protein